MAKAELGFHTADANVKVVVVGVRMSGLKHDFLRPLDLLGEDVDPQVVLHADGGLRLGVEEELDETRPWRRAFWRPKRIHSISRSRSMVPRETETPRISSISARVQGWW